MLKLCAHWRAIDFAQSTGGKLDKREADLCKMLAKTLTKTNDLLSTDNVEEMQKHQRQMTH